jgi:ABC-2 type transport system permease protein
LVFGHDIDTDLESAKACLGLVPQEINFNQFEKVSTILVNQAGFYGIPRSVARERIEVWLRKLQLWDKRDAISRSLSGGMKRRLMIARALVHEPKLLILDEPTAGVDIEVRRSMWEFLRQLNDAGTTIILTTHYLEEAENLCRNIAIIDDGRIIEHDRMATVLRKLHSEVFVLNLRQSLAAAPELPGYAIKLAVDGSIEVEVTKAQNLNDLFGGTVGARHRGRQHAQQGEPPRGTVHAARRRTRRGDRAAEARGLGMSAEARLTADAMPRGERRWVGFRTIVIREFSRIVRIWGQTLVPPAITATLYFIIFGSLIGRRIGDMGGVSYMQYIAPGLIMMSVITNSYGNVVSSFFGAKFGRHLEELLVAPLPNWLIVLGYIAGGVMRGLLVGLLVTIIALFFTRLHVEHLLAVLAAVLLTSVIFSLLGFVNAVFAKNFDQISFVPTFILTPMTYLGGVFYSITMLPEWAQAVSKANPILYMVNAFRYGFLGLSDVNLRASFLFMTAAAAALFALCVWLMEKGTGTRE